jgi:hypothetical protein
MSPMTTIIVLSLIYTLQFANTHANFSQFVFPSGCLVKDPNNVLFCSRPYQLATVSHPTHCSKMLTLKVSHIMTNHQLVSLSWFWGPSGSHDWILISVWHLLFYRSGRPFWQEVGSVICISNMNCSILIQLIQTIQSNNPTSETRCHVLSDYRRGLDW